jgi:hypothetical protein
MRTALDQSFGIIPPDIAARLDGDENAPVFDYFREPTLDELLNASAGTIESWGERDSREPDIMWCNHMALVTVRILAKLRDQQKGAA